MSQTKPIIIFRFLAHEGPGYLGDYLTVLQCPFLLIKVDEGEALPKNISDYSGMVLMGGPMSVNDDLPWIAPLLALIREAIDADIPVLGHCLGGQLMSKALGGVVSKNKSLAGNQVKEIGWGEVTVSQNSTAKQWFGDLQGFNAFHWHGETFSLPEGATHILASQHCHNQAWALGKHLAFQTHVEMTPDMVKKWCDEGRAELAESAASAAVMQADTMQQTLEVHCYFLNRVAKQVYSQWIEGLKT